ncbi:MAG: thioredoxin domain-containing protein, partial [Elusimicrobia bacterium]|nr:thioredoxin domain-containing protein [Elusimicrobiota bacterium]
MPAAQLLDGALRPPFPVSGRDHVRGSDKSSIFLLEYGDYDCPRCRAAHPLIEELREALGDELAFVYRHFPIASVHPNALLAAEAAEAADRQGKFWDMHDGLMARDPLRPRDILALADELDLDMEAFRSAIASGVARARI